MRHIRSMLFRLASSNASNKLRAIHGSRSKTSPRSATRCMIGKTPRGRGPSRDRSNRRRSTGATFPFYRRFTVKMTFAFVGAGGIGGYLGARLAAAGEDVVFIARGHHLEAMQREGLRLKSPEGDVRLERVRTTNDPAGIGPVDVVVAGVKLWDLESAMRSALPLVGKGTMVVGFQNGVEKEAILGRVA